MLFLFFTLILNLSFAAMKKYLSIAVLLPLLWSCADDKTAPPEKTEGDVDAARMFIRHALDGNYKNAQNLIVQDSANLEWLATAERSYLKENDVTEQRGLRESSIILYGVQKINDTASIIEYANSFRKVKQKVKTVKRNGQWLVDFKYTFQRTDSTGK